MLAYNLRSGADVVITQPVSGNLYISGGTVIINAPIHGDLVIAGGTVILNDSVTSDIMVCGGKVTLNGFAGDDIRCAGGEVHINGYVAGDVAGVGGTITIEKASVVNGGILIAGGTVTINGVIKENVKLTAGQLYINGIIEKDADCRGGDIQINGTVKGRSVLAANDITIGDNAAFYKDVQYWDKKANVAFKGSLKNTNAVYDPALRIDMPELKYLGFASMLALLWYLGAAFLMIILVRYLLKNILQQAATKQEIISGRSLGYGFLFSIAVPIAIVLCYITLIGIPVALILLCGYIIIAASGTIIAAVLITAWIQNSKGYRWNKWQFSGMALLVVVLLKLVTAMLPFIGWLVVALVILSSYGAILRNIKWRKTDTIPIA